MTDWETRYYEAEALHTESNGMLAQERDHWKAKAETLRESMRLDAETIAAKDRRIAELERSFSDETKRADDAVRALKGLSAWHDHRSLTGLPHGCPVPPAVPSFDTVVKAVHAAIGKPPYKAEEMPEEPK